VLPGGCAMWQACWMCSLVGVLCGGRGTHITQWAYYVAGVVGVVHMLRGACIGC
jgi:uncharacterized membrane protein YuzA (DUF378 family)